MKMTGIVSILLVCLCIQHSSAVDNPGVEMRITDMGFDYAGNVSVESLAKKIKVQNIPDQQWGIITVTSINISNFTAPLSEVVLHKGQGYSWELTGLGFTMQAKFSYNFIKAGGGSFEFVVADSAMNIQVTMGKNKSGQPTLKTSGCSYSISNYSIKFSGRGESIYNWLAKIFKGCFQRVFEKLFCGVVRTAINKNAERSFSKFPVTIDIGKKFAVKYGLLASPKFTSTYVSLPFSGEVFWKKKPTTTTLKASKIAPFNNTDKMVYFLVTDFPINTLGNVAMNKGLLRTTVTEKDLPDNRKYFLNTTCPGKMCIGKLILQTSVLFPNSKAEVQIKSSQDPKMTISSGGVSVNFGASMKFYVRLPNGKSTYMFTIKTKLNFSLSVTTTTNMTNGLLRLLADIDQTSLSVGLVDSQIGAINPNSLRQIVDNVVILYIIPHLNKLGSQGFPLPSLGKHLTYTNAEITLAKDTVIVGTDVQYKAPSEVYDHADWSEGNDQKMSFQVIGLGSRRNHRRFGKM